jgi:hypothetical protein
MGSHRLQHRIKSVKVEGAPFTTYRENENIVLRSETHDQYVTAAKPIKYRTILSSAMTNEAIVISYIITLSGQTGTALWTA